MPTTYYVRADGNDGNSGTGTGTGAAWASLNTGISRLSPGDTLYVLEAGGVFNERIASASVPNGSDWTIGSGGIYVAGYPGDFPIIRPSSGSAPLIQLVSKSYVIIGNLLFDAINDGSTAQGVVEFNGCDHIRFMDSEIANANWCGFLSSQSAGFSTYYELLRNAIHDGGRVGGGSAAAHGMYFAASSGSTTGLDAHHLAQRNDIYNFTALSNDSGIQIYGTFGVEADRLGGITLDGNRIWACSVGMYLANAVTVPIEVISNLVRDCTNDGVVMFHGLAGTKFYHNTLARNGGWGLQVGNNAAVTGALVKSNAFTDNASGPVKVCNADASSSATITNNGMNGNGNSNAVLDQNSLSTETGTVTGSPNYTNAGANDFHITGAPYVDAGVNVGVTTDADGNPRPSGSGYDIGAYEYQAGGSPSSSTSPSSSASPSASLSPSSSTSPSVSPSASLSPSASQSPSASVSRSPSASASPSPSPSPVVDSHSQGAWHTGPGTQSFGSFDNVSGDRLFIYAESAGGPGDVTDVTYNGVSLTKLTEVSIPGYVGGNGSIWEMIGPPTGSHTITSTRTGSGGNHVIVPISLRGTNTVGATPTTYTQVSVGATDFDATGIATHDNSYHLSFVRKGNFHASGEMSTDTATASLIDYHVLETVFVFGKPIPTAGSDTIHIVDSGPSDLFLSIDLLVAPLSSESSSPSPSVSNSPSPSSSVSPSVSPTPSASVSPSVSRSPSPSSSGSPSSSVSRSPSASVSSSPSSSPSSSVSRSPSASVSPSSSTSPSASVSPSASLSPSASGSPSASRSPSSSASRSLSASRSPSTSPSASGSPSASASPTPTPSPSTSPSASPSPAPTSPDADMVTYSDHDMQCPGDWENGFKEGRVMRFGDGERRLSDMRTGDWQGASFSLEISDFDRVIRQRLVSEQFRYWSDPLVVKMTDRATRAAKGTPYVVFVGPIIDAKVTGPSGMGWELTLGDIVSHGLLSDQAQAPWRRVGDGFLSQLTQVAKGLDLDTPEPTIYGIHKRLSTDGASGEGLVYKPTYLGIIDAGGGYKHLWMIAGHACAAVPAVQVNEAVSFDFDVQNGVDFQSDTFGNQRRYTLLYAPVTDPTFLDPEATAPAPEDVTDPDACARDEKALTVWVEGVEPNGDGSGAVITDRLLQYKHFSINYVAHQGQDSYQSGPWLENPTWSIFDVEVDAVDEDTYDEARTISLIRFPGDGYTGAGIIGAKAGDRKTLLEWIAAWNRSCSVRFGFNHLGQMQIFMLHPTQAIKDAAPLIDDVNVILKDSFTPQVLFDRRANRLPFLYDYNHATGQWMGVGTADDEISHTGYGKWYTGETRDYPFAPGITNASHIATIELWTTRFPSWRVTAESALRPLGMMDLGQYVRYRHFASIGTSASQIRLGWIERHQVQAGKRRVQVDLLDVDDLIGFDVPGEGPAGELNDRCETAREFVFTEPAADMSWWQRFTENTGAHTPDVSITALVAPNSDQKPAWFKFTAPSDGNLSVITTTTAYDDVLYFLDGTCGSDDWTVLGSNDDSVGVTAGAAIDLLAGQTVYILIVGKTADAFGYLLAQASFAPVV